MRRNLILILFLFIIFLVPLLSVSSANLSDAFGEADNDPLYSSASRAGFNVVDGSSVENVIGLVIQAVLGFLGVIFIALTIYAGYLWMTARGNEQQAEKAKNLISAAVIGLVIVVSAYAISIFVMSKLSMVALEKVNDENNITLPEVPLPPAGH